MAFFKKSKNQNFDIFSGYAWHVPGVVGLFGMLFWLLVGAVLSLIVVGAFSLFMPGVGMEYQQFVSYPIMFIPAMVASKYISNRNTVFERGYAIDSSHFGRLGGWMVALLCVVATFAAAFCMDAVSSLLPDMPDYWEEAFSSLTQGNFFINLLCVSVFAPIFEEWFFRGTILRGLLNHQDVDGIYDIKPIWAIVISSELFALIHMNPWQAIPAFALGMLFGYVYYKTGSLKLTMLMHCANNTIALLIGQFADIDDSAAGWMDILPLPAYLILFILFLAFLYWFVMELGKIEQIRPQGNCDEVKVIDELP